MDHSEHVDFKENAPYTVVLNHITIVEFQLDETLALLNRTHLLDKLSNETEYNACGKRLHGYSTQIIRLSRYVTLNSVT